VVVCIDHQVSVAESTTWSPSSVVIYCVILVIFLTVFVSVFAVTAAVNVGHGDLHLPPRSTSFSDPVDSDQFPLQSASTTTAVLPLPVSKLSTTEQGKRPAERKISQ